MPFRLFFRLSIVALLLCLTLIACRNGDELNEDQDRRLLQAMETEIDELIGIPDCNQGQDCRAIAFGTKPCGGPWNYKVYSVAELDTVHLADLVAEYNRFNEILNRRHGWASDCMFVSEPRVTCLDGRCVAVYDYSRLSR